jgi:hypothetical protein
MRNRRVFADPDAIVNYTAEVFDEMAIDLRSNSACGFVQQHVDASLGRLGRQSPPRRA